MPESLIPHIRRLGVRGRGTGGGSRVADTGWWRSCRSVVLVETRTLVLGVVGVLLSFLILINVFNPWRFFLVHPKGDSEC